MKLTAFLVLPLLLLSGFSNAAETWSDDIVYFVIIDRFADGDSTNNYNLQRNNPGGYHGGDIRGLSAQLDELAELGITALWINPVQKQIDKPSYAQAPKKLGIPEFQHWGFHGYWIDDFTRIDPHLGDLADLKYLVDEAHKRNIKVLLDVVYNHVGYGSQYTRRKTASGENWVRLGEGNCSTDPETCRVGGLPDLKTEIPEIRQYVLNANLKLAKASGADGFRLDTYKHIASDFWQEHRQRTRTELGQDFFLLAEIWGADATSLSKGVFARDEVDGGFDFSFKGSCESFVNGRGRPIAFASYLGKRHKVREGYQLAHYLSTHDETMGLHNMDNDVNKFRLCAAVQMTSLGMPVIYYGEEVARSGSEWPTNRRDMPWAERNIQPGKGEKRDEALRDFYKQIISLRRKHSAFTMGDYQLLTGADDPLLAYGRIDAAGRDTAIVLVNRENKSLTANYPLPATWQANSQLSDAMSGDTFTLKGQKLQLEMQPLSVRILLPTGGQN